MTPNFRFNAHTAAYLTAIMFAARSNLLATDTSTFAEDIILLQDRFREEARTLQLDPQIAEPIILGQAWDDGPRKGYCAIFYVPQSTVAQLQDLQRSPLLLLPEADEDADEDADTRPWIVISFRGLIPGLVPNSIPINTLFSPFRAGSIAPGFQAHQGFQRQWYDMRDAVYAALKTIVSSLPDAQLILSSHSLGCAMGDHLALECLYHPPKWMPSRMVRDMVMFHLLPPFAFDLPGRDMLRRSLRPDRFFQLKMPNDFISMMPCRTRYGGLGSDLVQAIATVIGRSLTFGKSLQYLHAYPALATFVTTHLQREAEMKRRAISSVKMESARA